MSPPRSSRRLATTLVIVMSFVFAQLALAQYLCPTPAVDDQQIAAVEMAPGMSCDDMQPQGEQPALCHHHCTNAAQSFEPLKLPTLSLPAIVQVLVLPLRVDAAKQRAVAFAGSREAQPPPSPIFLSTLRLRV